MNYPFKNYTKYLKEKYKGRIQKITVDAGFSCPNRDGLLGTRGCIYCNNDSFAPTHLKGLSITEQIDHGIETSQRRYRKIDKYFVYFQSFSNTYAPLYHLKKIYEEALSHPKVIGLCIGTRPDCIDKSKLDYIESLAKNYDITIEYGLESMSDESLRKIERGHDYQCFIDAINFTANRNINICVHIILGFPWETEKLWLETAEKLSALPIDFLKIHQLHVVRGTKLGDLYKERPFEMISKEKYISILIKFLEKLNPQIVIQRLYGNAPKELMISKEWNTDVSAFMNEISERMINLQTYQGKYFKNEI